MARAILLALSFTALASDARYVDYSGIKMPEYGVEVADYHYTRDGLANSPDVYRERSLEASAPLDYKYEEDLTDQSATSKSDDNMEVDTADLTVLQTLQKKEKRPPLLNYDSNLHSQNMVPKFQKNNKFLLHRPRASNKKYEREVDISNKKYTQYVQKNNEDMGDFDNDNSYHIKQDDRHERKNINFDDNKNIFVSRGTTGRVRKARRKPRDRYVKSEPEDDFADNIDEMLMMRKLDKEGRSDVDYPEGREDRLKVANDLNKEDKSDVEYLTGNERRRLSTGSLDKESRRSSTDFYARNKGRRFRPAIDRGSAQRYYPDSDNLEDTTLKSSSKLKPTKGDDYDDYYDVKRIYNIKKKLPSLHRKSTTATTPELTTLQWAYRRANIMAPIPPIPTSTVDIKTTTSTVTIFVTTTNTAATIETSTIVRKELSIQEKSRLSILKKAQRKESISNETSTKKPPVLLQVAAKRQTVVIVEPPSSRQPFLRAREVSGDTSDRLHQVKRLMRHKLVANAKNIHDLTDNWDEMVCDYIDVSLLKNSAITNNICLLTFAHSIFFFMLSR